MTKFKKTLLAAATAAMIASPGLVQAAAMMSISDGISTVQVTDGGLGDSNPVAGVITWIGAIGVWTVNVDTGLSKPVLGSAAQPHMDFNFVDVSSGAGTLTLMFTDVDFSGTGTLPLGTGLGGTSNGTVAYSVYADSANVAFGMEQLVASLGPLGGAYSGTASGNFDNAGGLYSLTQLITITHTRDGVSSGDAELRVPEPGILALLGLGLAGVGFMRRRRG